MSLTNAVSLSWALQYMTRVVNPESEPVTVEEVRAQLRVDPDMDDAYLMRLARVARHVVERYTMRSWAAQTLRIECHVRRPLVPLPLSYPFRQLVSVSYWDAGGVEAAVSPSLYTLALGTVPATIDLSAAPDSYRYAVTYQAGDEVAPPEDIRHAILALAAWAFNQPDGTMPESKFRITGKADVPPMVALLCEPYRLEVFSW